MCNTCGYEDIYTETIARIQEDDDEDSSRGGRDISISQDVTNTIPTSITDAEALTKGRRRQITRDNTGVFAPIAVIATCSVPKYFPFFLLTATMHNVCSSIGSK